MPVEEEEERGRKMGGEANVKRSESGKMKWEEMLDAEEGGREKDWEVEGGKKERKKDGAEDMRRRRIKEEEEGDKEEEEMEKMIEREERGIEA